MPKSRIAYWEKKFKRNVRRDRRTATDLKALGWRPVIVWECQTKDPSKLYEILRKCVINGVALMQLPRQHRQAPIPERDRVPVPSPARVVGVAPDRTYQRNASRYRRTRRPSGMER
jgi:hypothetical protein